MRAFRSIVLAACVSCSLPVLAQDRGPVQEKFDTEVMGKIKVEGTDGSKIMETISYLTDVHGPRLTGSPITKKAGEWTTAKLTEWGLENAHLEAWGPFGTGWTLEGFEAHMVEPTYSTLIAFPKAWSPSTPQKIVGEPIYLKADKPEDLDKYRGKLNKAIVLISPPREVKAWFEAPGTRKTDQQLLDLANADANARRRRPGGPGGPGAAGAPGAPGAQATPGAPGNNTPPAGDAAGGPNANPEIRRMMEQGRGSMQLQADKWQLCYDEGAAVVIEPGRGDGGTVFVQSVTMPRRADPASRTGDNPFSRGPRPWATDESQILPQVVMSAEHYNRLVRMVEKEAHPKVEIDIASKFHKGDDSSFNVIAEIPGTDLKDEIVMLGAHFDSWHSGTGATDNAVGCGVALEAVRILKAIDAKPRRTIRVALWTGEEQGLLGSKAYVTDHFGSATGGGGGFGGGGGRGGAGGEGGDGERRRPRIKYELKPEHEKLSCYFNLDNGTGKIRGIHLQGNEALRPMFRQWFAQFNDMGASTITHANTGGTDHLSFDSVGLPGFQFIQDEIEYDTRTHHSSMDVYERIQADDVKQASVIMASFVYQAAVRDEKLTRKPLDGEIALPTPAPAGAAAGAAAGGAGTP